MKSLTIPFSNARNLVHDMPRLENLKLTPVLNSVVACRVCRGQRMVALASKTTMSFSYVKCVFCNGSGTMSNRESSYGK